MVLETFEMLNLQTSPRVVSLGVGESSGKQGFLRVAV